MELSNRKALVLGAGRSGIASAKFLAKRGSTVALYDRKSIDSWSDEAKALKESHGVGLVDRELPSWLLDQIDLVVISPGVPTNTIPAQYVDRKDGEVIGEVELASRFLKGKTVSITGSNGKTTTTTLIGKILFDAGLKTQVGGNIGTPLLSLVESSTDDTWTVVELSSFQLETIVDFRPDVALCLNVTPNHLDRYEGFVEYAAAKRRIFMNQTQSDLAILNADDAVTAEWATQLATPVQLFSTKRELNEGVFLRGRELVSRKDGIEAVVTTRDEIFLLGLHNVENILAASAAAMACGVAVESIRRSVAYFRGVEHRIEFTGEIAGVRFYNDSKATSVDATIKALEAMADGKGKTILILGGRGKQAPYTPLIPLIESSVRHLVVIGEDAGNIESQLSGFVSTTRADSFKSSIRLAFEAAQDGDKVLLAPACASFDMFSSFEERGSRFKKHVAELKAAAAHA